VAAKTAPTGTGQKRCRWEPTVWDPLTRCRSATWQVVGRCACSTLGGPQGRINPCWWPRWWRAPPPAALGW